MPIPHGTQLMAQDGNRWLLVTVVGDRAEGSLNVHWEDNSGRPDEFLPRTKLAIEPGRLARIRADYVRSKSRSRRP